jgi:HK97 family phage major capsid protein
MQTEDLIQLVTENHAAVVANYEKTQKALAENEKAVKGVNASVTNLEQKIARRGQGDGGPMQDESWGATIVNSEAFKAFKDGGARRPERLEVKAVSTITSGATLAGSMIPPHVETTTVALPKRRMTIRSLLAPGTTNSNSVWFSRQTQRQNLAATVSEGVPKPQSDAHFSQIQTPVQTVAHFMQCSRNALDDAPALQSTIDAELRYGLALAEENLLLMGDGTGTNLLGLIPQSTPAGAPPFTPSLVQGIDTLAFATLQAEVAYLPANGLVLHPQDWLKLRLLKTTTGEYILGNPATATVPQLFGLPVVATPAINVGTFLVGSFDLAAQIYDRMAVEVLLSTEAGTNFTSNQVTIRAEERLALAVKQPLGLIYGTFP